MNDASLLLEAVKSQSKWIAATLRDLVEIESPSDNKPAVDAAVRHVAALATALGGRVKLHRQKNFGDVLAVSFNVARFGPARNRLKPILLLGHLDTVWPLGTLREMPWRECKGRDGTRVFGPGILDMKAGIVMALASVRALTQLGIHRPITLLLNSDEEVGSPISRPITERLALASQAVLVLEPAQGLACKTSRKGVGLYRLQVTGVAAHSGVDFARGHSAILELARLLQTVAGFTDPRLGRTVNPGVISGGSRANVVAEHAFAEVDVRITRASDAARVDRLFHRLRCADPACKLQVVGGLTRPPMERKPATAALYKQARKLASSLGFQLDEAASGGGSDGNFTAALGVPTLDGLGAVGEGAHAAHESILLDPLFPRTALLAALLISYGTSPSLQSPPTAPVGKV
jgi:glutamate carboxypeptidase